MDRLLPTEPTSSNRLRRRSAIALAAACCLAALGLLGGSSAPARDLHAQLDRTKAKLSHAKAREGVLSTTIQRYDTRLRQLEGQVASLRNEIAIARTQLRRIEASLARDRQHLNAVRARLDRSLALLSTRLVAIYKADSPDALTVILSAHGYDDLVTRYAYLRRIEQQDTDLVAQVRRLRDRARSTVHRVRRERDGIATRKAELAQAVRELAARQSELTAARNQQQGALAQVKQSEVSLEGSVSAIQSKIAAQIAAAQQAEASSSAPVQPAGPTPGQTSGSGQVSSAGLIWPVNGPVVSPFGPRTINGHYEFHPGIDISVPTGTPIHAAASGTVLFTQPESSSGGYGNYTCIDHGNGLSTCYAHQESFAVAQGQHVTQGQVIGYSDCTGYCFGPHLHFEVRINGQVQNPLDYLP
jgi:murein DD-endopeptidase MepM/ murein hydrolase activator NlpD